MINLLMNYALLMINVYKLCFLYLMLFLLSNVINAQECNRPLYYDSLSIISVNQLPEKSEPIKRTISFIKEKNGLIYSLNVNGSDLIQKIVDDLHYDYSGYLYKRNDDNIDTSNINSIKYIVEIYKRDSLSITFILTDEFVYQIGPTIK